MPVTFTFSLTMSFACFLGGHEEHFFAAARYLAHGVGGLFQLYGRFVEVDDVDALLLREDVGGHVGVPLAAQVAKVYSCLQEGIKINACHSFSLLLGSLSFFPFCRHSMR
jgi:hypothetical protein